MSSFACHGIPRLSFFIACHHFLFPDFYEYVALFHEDRGEFDFT